MTIKSAFTALSASFTMAFATGALAAPAAACVDFTGAFDIVDAGKVVESLTLTQTACESILVTYSDASTQTLAMDGVGRVMQSAPNGRTLEFVGYALADRSRFLAIVIDPAGNLTETSVFTMSLNPAGDIVTTSGSLSSSNPPALETSILVKSKAAPPAPVPAPVPAPPITPAISAKLQKFLRKFAH